MSVTAPDYTLYPDGSYLLARLQSTGLVEAPPTEAAALIDYDERMLEVAQDLESGTGYKPFLAEASESTTPYKASDIVNGRLSLRGGMVSVSGITVNGTAQVLDTDYRLLPADAAIKGEPFKEIDFGFIGCSRLLSYGVGSDVIEITGIRGYSATLPANVYGAMLDRGCSLVAPQISLQISGGRTGIKAGKVALEFVRSSGNRTSSGGPLSGEAATWDERWKSIVRRYRR